MSANYPPGVSDTDLDRHFGDLTTCCQCGNEFFTTGADTCPRCLADEDKED